MRGVDAGAPMAGIDGHRNRAGITAQTGKGKCPVSGCVSGAEWLPNLEGRAANYRVVSEALCVAAVGDVFDVEQHLVSTARPDKCCRSVRQRRDRRRDVPVPRGVKRSGPRFGALEDLDHFTQAVLGFRSRGWMPGRREAEDDENLVLRFAERGCQGSDC